MATICGFKPIPAFVSVAVLLQGCATYDGSGSTFAEVCRAQRAALKTGNQARILAVERAMSNKGLNSTDCARINDASGPDTQATASTAEVVGAVAALAILAAIAARGGGGAQVSQRIGQVSDYQWDWDAFNDQYGRLTWACRGVQSGEFADLWRCNSKIQSDNRWPGLQLR